MKDKEFEEGETYIEVSVPKEVLRFLIERVEHSVSFKVPATPPYGTIMECKPAQYVPFQLCPKCTGQGTVSKPPYVAGDVNQWSATATGFTCDVCHGAKIIPMCVLKTEQ